MNTKVMFGLACVVVCFSLLLLLSVGCSKGAPGPTDPDSGEPTPPSDMSGPETLLDKFTRYQQELTPGAAPWAPAMDGHHFAGHEHFYDGIATMGYTPFPINCPDLIEVIFIACPNRNPSLPAVDVWTCDWTFVPQRRPYFTDNGSLMGPVDVDLFQLDGVWYLAVLDVDQMLGATMINFYRVTCFGGWVNVIPGSVYTLPVVALPSVGRAISIVVDSDNANAIFIYSTDHLNNVISVWWEPNFPVGGAVTNPINFTPADWNQGDELYTRRPWGVSAIENHYDPNRHFMTYTTNSVPEYGLIHILEIFYTPARDAAGWIPLMPLPIDQSETDWERAWDPPSALWTGTSAGPGTVLDPHRFRPFLRHCTMLDLPTIDGETREIQIGVAYPNLSSPELHIYNFNIDVNGFPTSQPAYYDHLDETNTRAVVNPNDFTERSFLPVWGVHAQKYYLDFANGTWFGYFTTNGNKVVLWDFYLDDRILPADNY